MQRRLTSLLLLLSLSEIHAATLFGVVSERSAAELASASHEFTRSYPGHQLILRTPEQLAALSDQQIRSYLTNSDAVLLVAVFGDSVPRLANLLGVHKHPRLLAMHSDRRLVNLSRWQGRPLFAGLSPQDIKQLNSNPQTDQALNDYAHKLKTKFPQQSPWIDARAYWQARGTDNMARLLGWLLAAKDSRIKTEPPLHHGNRRWFQAGRVVDYRALKIEPKKKTVAILDHQTGDRQGDIDLLNQLCTEIKAKDLNCFAILSAWGETSSDSVKRLYELKKQLNIGAVISLHDFVIGGGNFRQQSDAWLAKLDVPVFRGIRLTDRQSTEWQDSEDGLPWNSVHYRVAMPELQGISQPMVLATTTPQHIDPLTGLALSITAPESVQVKQMTARVDKWLTLQTRKNFDKRLAIIYYNHPPGRHNIGADNLDVPASLFQLLQQLKKAGYDTGKLPASQEALLDQIQQRGINLPEDAAAIRAMAPHIQRLPAGDYKKWLGQLPEALQAEMEQGPLAKLDRLFFSALDEARSKQARALLDNKLTEVRHLIEGAKHPARERALNLMEQLSALYEQALKGANSSVLQQQTPAFITALRDTGIEGLRGWGAAPGKVMVHNNELLLPGLRFGKVFIGPQPPRGWELDEELLHANTSFPPTHQYLGLYLWLQKSFKADALIHLGRHSTYEFMPHKRVGLSAENDYPMLIAGEIPGIYPYIVDGVGEGIQAKRRGMAVMIDHLTPPLATTELYDQLLQLRQLVESYESASGDSAGPARSQAITAIRQMVKELKLIEELSKSMEDVLAVRGIGFDEVDDELLVHEVGHYLTKLQESFMPHGLHVFGRNWKKPAITTMLTSMGDTGKDRAVQKALRDSPKLEMAALLAALDGRFVLPGKGNDPIRTAESLPTGRNFHALDGGVLPTPLAYKQALQLSVDARKKPLGPEGRDAVVLWASDTVRDEGVMTAFGMDLLGIKPVWNSRGILQGIERLKLDKERVRRDVVFTTSGLFRDLYGNLLVWLDRSVLLALDGASDTIRKKYPELAPALESALAPLEDLSNPGSESLEQNLIAAHWLSQTRLLLSQGVPPASAGRQASLRLFGDAPGGYGTGINRLVERSGAWQDRSQLATTYRRRMGHAYGSGLHGEAAHASLDHQLSHVDNTYLGRSSNLYGLMDNNDAFDYLGGLSMTVESLKGSVPENHVIHNADPTKLSIEPLQTALLAELRGQFLNPQWIKPLMEHGYAGARTMGSEFWEYLWGWQVTNPESIKSWVWDEVKDVYLHDRHNLGVDKFLEQDHNVHVKTNMLAILLVSAHKGYWQTDEETLKQVAEDFARLVSQHGLPGSGHTRPDHPIMDWISPMLDPALRLSLQQQLNAALGEVSPQQAAATTIAEVELQESSAEDGEASDAAIWLTVLVLLALFAFSLSGFIYARKGGKF